MADIEHSIIINQNVVEVFKVATAFEDEGVLKQWQPALKTVGITAGNPLRSGSMVAMTKHFIMSDIFVNADVLDLQRNKRIDLKGFHGRFPFQREIEFTPNGRDTQITDRIWLKTGFIYFWWRPVVISSLRSQTASEWKNLKQMLES